MIFRELALTTAPIAQIQTLAVTTYSGASTYRVTLGSPGSADVVVDTPGSVNADTTEANIATAINASAAAAFCTADASGPDIVITARAGGVPLTISTTVVGGTGTMSNTTTQAYAVAGDLDISGGTLHIIDGPAACAQRIACRLRTLKGEWIFDVTLGTPWFQEILGAGARTRLGLIQQIIRDRIRGSPGVTRIEELNFEFEPSTRGLMISGRVQVEGGSTVPISLEFG